MPRIDEITKLRIISRIEEGWSVRKTASHYNINKNSVTNIVTKWRQQGSFKRRPGSGRPKITTIDEDEQLIKELRAHPFHTVVDAAVDSNFPGSVRTARRRVQESKLKCVKLGKEATIMKFALQHLPYSAEFWQEKVKGESKSRHSRQSKEVEPTPKRLRLNEDTAPIDEDIVTTEVEAGSSLDVEEIIFKIEPCEEEGESSTDDESNENFPNDPLQNTNVNETEVAGFLEDDDKIGKEE